MPTFSSEDSIKWEELFGDGHDGVFVGDGDLFSPHTLLLQTGELTNMVGFYEENLVIIGNQLDKILSVGPLSLKYGKYNNGDVSVIKQFKNITVPRGARVGTNCGHAAVFMAQESINIAGRIESDVDIFFIAPIVEITGSIFTPGTMHIYAQKAFIHKAEFDCGNLDIRYSNLLNCREGEIATHDDTYLNGTDSI